MMPDRADFTGTRDAGQILWQPAEVTSPHLGRPVPVIAARDIPYIRNANRLQNLSIYLPRTPRTAGLIGTRIVLVWSGGGRYSADTAIPLHAPHWRLSLRDRGKVQRLRMALVQAEHR
jgi:hypothetical protein